MVSGNSTVRGTSTGGDLLARGNSIVIRGNAAAGNSSQQQQHGEKGWFINGFMIRGCRS